MTAGFVRSDETGGGRKGPRRRRGLAILGLLVLLLAVGGAVLFWNLALQAEAARDDIEARLAELTGLSVRVEGKAGFTLLPRTQLSLTDIRIGSPGNVASGTQAEDAILRIDALVADLDLLPALLGTTRVKRLSIIGPELLSGAQFIGGSAATEAEGPSGKTVRVISAADGAGAESATADAYRRMSAYLGAFLSRFEDLRALEIREGVFRMSRRSGPSGISNANILVSWPSKAAAARLSGTYVWNGQPTDIDLTLAEPLAFLAGEPSGIDLDLSSPALTVGFAGDGSTAGAGRFAGRLRVATPSLTRSIRWLGNPRAALPDIGAMSIEATLDGYGRNLALRDASVSLDGFAGEGAVEMLMPAGGKPSVGGTLAFERLDLTGFAEAVAPFPTLPFDFQRTISVAFLDHLDLDLRLSAASGGIGTLPIDNLAATMKFKDGVGTVDIGDSSLLGGRGQARLSIDSRTATPRIVGFASAKGVDAARLLKAIGVETVAVSGTSDVSAEIDAPVTRWTDLLQRNRMTLTVSARSGALSGFDPDVFLGSGTRPFALATEPTSIPFESLRAKLSTSGPLVSLDRVTLTGAAGEFVASGDLSTATNEVNVSGSFVPAKSPAAGPAANSLATSQSIGFTLQGKWPRPSVTSGLPIEPI
ncbi:MAG: hypothetical protein H7Y08_11710 [Rhizobiaceae bacterium]|nr:hypothetical protein [Rhizobiaceae bacterium]